MEEENMILKDLPVSTRNYTIIDNVTGKPISQETYSLTIDKEVVKKLNKLKEVNEEKIKQASLRNQYSDSTLVSTFTPQNDNVFSPIYEGEYIDAQDYVASNNIEKENIEEQIVEFNAKPEIIESDSILSRVIARDPNDIPKEEPEEIQEEVVEEKPDVDYITADDFKNQDNSTFTPENSSLQSASEQIIKIDTDKVKEVKGSKLGANNKIKTKQGYVDLDRSEIREGRPIAWLAYLLFFIPLIFKKNNRFVRIHANEGLDLNIMEILGAIMLLPYFLIKTTGTAQIILMSIAILGFVILAACALTIIPMILTSLFGAQFQIPFLWKKRIIKVNENRI